MKNERLKLAHSIILLGIISLGLYLRLYRLDYLCLWYDEVKSVSIANEFRVSDIWDEEDAIKPLFYLFILRPWIKTFGLNEYSARFPAVILGCIAIFLLYKLGSFIFDKPIGLICAFLLAISPFSIYYSQQADYSSMKIPAVILTMLLFFRYLKLKKGLFPLTLVNAALLYIHPACFFAVIIQNAVILLVIKDKGIYRKWFYGQIFIMFLLCLWVLIFKRIDSLHRTTYWVATPALETIFRTFEAFGHGVYRFANGGTGFSVHNKYLLYPRILLGIHISLLLFSLFRLKRTDEDYPKVVIILIWLLLPIFSLFVFSRLFFPIYTDRYLMYCLPAYILLVGYAFSRLRSKKVQFVLIAAVFLLNLSSLRIIYEPSAAGVEGESAWREMGNKIRSKIKKGDVVVLSPLRQIVPFWFYFKPEEKTNRVIDIMGCEMKESWETIFSDGEHLIMGPALGMAREFIAKYGRELEQAKSVWFVASPSWPGQNDACGYIYNYLLARKALNEHCEYPYHGVELYHFSRE